jgi:hypothetical protein
MRWPVDDGTAFVSLADDLEKQVSSALMGKYPGALGLVVNALILWTTGTGKESWRRPLNLSKAKVLR